MAAAYWLRIGTRGSPLALAQTRETRRLLAKAHGADEDSIEIVVIRTTGDMIQDRALSQAGGKGLFTKELDAAMLEGRIDIAVHSSKDLPTLMPDGIVVAGFLPREDVRDVLIAAGPRSIADLPKGANVGTASLRRGAQVKRLRPDVTISLLRGNVETRLRKVEAGEYDASLLALAGLKRLGLADKAAAILSEDDFLPAVGQGAVGITARTDDARTLARPRADPRRRHGRLRRRGARLPAHPRRLLPHADRWAGAGQRRPGHLQGHDPEARRLGLARGQRRVRPAATPSPWASAPATR